MEALQTDDCVGHCNHSHCGKVKASADYLIENDVVIQKHGHWILKVESFFYSGCGEYDEEFYVECSECGRRVCDFDYFVNDYATHVLETHPYCNCGAKMDSVQEDGE